MKRLSSSDPFTAIYQLEDGSILVTNEDLSQGIPDPENEYDPPIVQWTGPDDEIYNIFDGEVITYFVDAATQSDIEQFITDHNLHVIMSWFEPPDEVLLGNALAWFHFEYDQNEFPTFDDAFNFFAAHELIESVWPAFSDGLHRWHTGNTNPNDYYYRDNKTRHINIFGVDQSQRVPLGPSTPGNWFSDQVVAVIDDGVDRWHEDFHILGFPWFYRKISWVGANVYRRSYWVRYWAGEPNWYDPVRQGLASHGTRVSGFITASTNNAGIGVASLAPRTLVLPLRMRQNFEGLFYPDCEVKAVRALRFKFAHGQWRERVRVVNMSFGGERPWYWWGYPSNRFNLKKNINRDLWRNDRLYVASAGNVPQSPGNTLSYPAAHDNVLGVSGLITNYSGSQYWRWLNGWGSNYRYDYYQTYPVSGIYDFREHYYDWWNFDTWISRTTSVPGNWQYATQYDWFGGTSACAPEAAALASLLYTERPWVSYRTVWNRIVSTRDGSTARFPIAGLMDFEEALTGW